MLMTVHKYSFIYLFILHFVFFAQVTALPSPILFSITVMKNKIEPSISHLNAKPAFLQVTILTSTVFAAGKSASFNVQKMYSH